MKTATYRFQFLKIFSPINTQIYDTMRRLEGEKKELQAAVDNI